MIGEEQVTTVSYISLQGGNHIGRCQVTGQVLPTAVDADAVTHYPAHGIVLDVQFVDGGGSEDHALASVHIIGLEPLDGCLLITAVGIVIGHEHGHLGLGGSTHIGQAVGSESLQLVLAGVGLSTQVPLVCCQAHCQDAAGESAGGIEVHDTGAAVVHYVIPGTQHVGVGQVFPCLNDVGVGSEAIGIEVPHTVVVTLDASALEGVDRALIQAAHKLHAAIDVVAAVVINLALGIADDGLRAPDVAILATLAAAVDTGSVSLGDTAYSYGELGSVIGEEQITTVGGKGLQRFDGCGRCQVAGQILPAAVDADAVAHYPAGRLALDVEVVDGRGSEQDTLAGLHIIVLEPSHGVFLVGRGLVVFRNKHGNDVGALLGLIVDVQAHGLAFGHASVGIAGLDCIGNVNIGRSLLDKVAVHHTIQVDDIHIVLDNLDTRLAWHRGVGPLEGHLTATGRILGMQVGHGLTGVHRLQINV